MKFRQVKLPRDTERHPLLEGLEAVMKEKGYTISYIARSHFKIRAQALHAWQRKAKKKRDFNIPVRQVIKLCQLTGQPPYLYNPELWPNREWLV